MACLPRPTRLRVLLARFPIPLPCLYSVHLSSSHYNMASRPGPDFHFFSSISAQPSFSLSNKKEMLTHYYWLSSLPLIASAIGHAYPPIGLKPRYLATGTGVPLPSTSPPPYPTGTGTANETAVPTGSTAASTATSTSISSSELFFLVVADSGTDLDGSYLQFSGAVAFSGALLLYPRAPPLVPYSSVLFNINADSTLGISEYICLILGGVTWPALSLGIDTGPTANDPFNNPYNLLNVICEVVGGKLACEAGGRTVFSICPDTLPSAGFTGSNLDIGPTVEPGCTEVTLLVVPV